MGIYRAGEGPSLRGLEAKSFFVPATSGFTVAASIRLRALRHNRLQLVRPRTISGRKVAKPVVHQPSAATRDGLPFFHLVALSLTRLDAGLTPHVVVESARLYSLESLSGSLRPPRQVPPWRAFDCILHRLDHRPAFMQTATASICATTLRARTVFRQGEPGKGPRLLVSVVVCTNLPAFPATDAPIRTCTFQIAPLLTGRIYTVELSARHQACVALPTVTIRSAGRSLALARSGRGMPRDMRYRCPRVWYRLRASRAPPRLGLAPSFQMVRDSGSLPTRARFAFAPARVWPSARVDMG